MTLPVNLANRGHTLVQESPRSAQKQNTPAQGNPNEILGLEVPILYCRMGHVCCSSCHTPSAYVMHVLQVCIVMNLLLYLISLSLA